MNAIRHLPLHSEIHEASGIANVERTAKLKLVAGVVSLAIVLGAAGAVLLIGFAVLKFIAIHFHF